MNYPSLKALALVLLGASHHVWGQTTQTPCRQSLSPGFDFEVDATETFTIRWSIDLAQETVSFQAVSESVSWVGIGFSSDGNMVVQDSVIGLPDEATVLEYLMEQRNINFVLPFEDMEITQGIVSQGATSTTLSFTRPLAPEAEGKLALSAETGDSNTLIYAFGQSNVLANHGPTQRGSITLDLTCGFTLTPAPTLPEGFTAAPTGLTGAPTLAITMAPTLAAGSTAAPSSLTAAPTLADGATAAPTAEGTLLPSDTPTPSPVVGERGTPGFDTSTTASPSSLEDGDGQDTDGATRVGGGGWAAAAAAGVVAAIAALAL